MMQFEQMTIEGAVIGARPEKSNALKLRERMEQGSGFEGFDSFEILETMIGFVNPASARDLAYRLIDAFGSLKGVLEARPEQLRSVKGCAGKTASFIASMVPMFRAWTRENMQDVDTIGNSRAAEAYCKSLLAGCRNERFYVIALNARCKVIGTRKISEGSLSEVSAYPRMVMETALNYNAHSVLLSHNHPGGTCAASPEDVSSTIQLQKLLQGVGILVLDHIIVSGDSTYSMIQHGDIDYRTRR